MLYGTQGHPPPFSAHSSTRSTCQSSSRRPRRTRTDPGAARTQRLSPREMEKRKNVKTETETLPDGASLLTLEPLKAGMQAQRVEGRSILAWGR